ncbi:hypothetical protein EYR38_006175 [Pleurotus pulmonarius]|nr:hypothetical protein EYR38_006175 [Pleurotus pulmonarius]
MKFLNLLVLAPSAFAATYNLVDNILGTAFLTTFNFQAISDPTHGRVLRLNLTYAAGDTFILRADSKTVLDPNGPGRNSVRIQSKKAYTTHVSVTSAQNDCNVAVNSNAGCGVKMSDSRSYGPAFNSNGGGWFAVERTSTFIKAWFWPRNAGNVPADVKNGQTVVNTGSWGTPSAYFPNTQCDIASHFKAHNIIINLRFCGDWAGSAYSSSGCPSSCVDFVNKNPGSFNNAFFDFASLRVYT